jgi:hypothetical protein
MLGAGKATIEETVNAPPLPEVVQARAQRLERVEQRERLTGISTAIRERIEAQPLGRPRHAQPRRRARHVHPDQLALGL